MEIMTIPQPAVQFEAQPLLTFQEFMEQTGERTHAELEDGKMILISPASRKHQHLLGWLHSILRYYARHNAIGELLSAPFSVRLREMGQVREPDILFIKTEILTRVRETHVDGAPDLIVEIISPESIDQDRGRKFVEYEAEATPEYWLIDPIRNQAEFYRLGDDKRYHQALADADGIFHSQAVPGFWLRVAGMWKDPLPNDLNLLRELGVLS